MDKINQFLLSHKITVGCLLVGSVLIISGFISSSQFKQFFSPSSNVSAKGYSKDSLVAKADLLQIKVDVAGAVKNPGVYSIYQGSRIEDAIKAAGGFSNQANSQFISKNINLSQKISDGQKIYIPVQGETSVSTLQAANLSSVVSPGGAIGINSADSKELDQLPGIGVVTAGKIINGRPYGSIEELLSKKVVSKSVFDKIKDQINLN